MPRHGLLLSAFMLLNGVGGHSKPAVKPVGDLAELTAMQCRLCGITVRLGVVLSEKPVTRPGIAIEHIKEPG